MAETTELEQQVRALQQRLAALEEKRTSFRGRFKPTPKSRRLIVATLFCFVGIPLLHAAVPHTFTAGTAAVAADVNANFTHLDEVSVPVGGIIGWHKSFANVPALPASGKWVECNGQVLADAGSPLNGQTIPNLNGAAGGADSPGQSAKVAMFLRGGTTSGTGQQDAFQGHWHQVGNGGGPAGNSGSSGRFTESPDAGWADGLLAFIRDAKTDGTNGTPRTANETRPVNMSVVWIMRVK